MTDQPLSDDALRARIAAYPWFHSIALRPGIVTAGTKAAAVLAAEEEALLGPLPLEGLTVLDIGAWNGFHSLAARRRGAARVLATDSHCWDHPHYRGRETLELCAAELGLDIETLHLDPTQIGSGLGRFDVVLFLGVFYHLRDPIPVMDALGAVTGQCLLIETHQDALEQPRPMMVFYPGTEVSDDATNWWGPNPPLMLHLLLQAGFDRIYYRNHPAYGTPRGMYAAFRPGTPERLWGGYAAGGWIGLTHPDEA